MTIESARVFVGATNALIAASLRAGRTIRFTITTTSMLPVLAPGDQVIVRDARQEDLRLGDIVLLQADELRIAHRLIGWRRIDGMRALLTKGDHVPAADRFISRIVLRGFVITIQRGQRQMNLQSVGARELSRLIALLSRGEAVVYRVHAGLFRRIVLKGLRVGLRAGGRVLGALT